LWFEGKIIVLTEEIEIPLSYTLVRFSMERVSFIEKEGD